MSARSRLLRAARRLAAALPAVALLLAPALAGACAVCGGGNPANRFTFFMSTIALSVLPLGMFAAGFLWLRSKLGDRAREEFMDRDAMPRRVHDLPPEDPNT